MEKIFYSNGYVGIINEDGFRELEHRFVWRTERGSIPEDHFIHHLDGNKTNNKIENLICVSRKEHGRIHKELRLKRNP